LVRTGVLNISEGLALPAPFYHEFAKETLLFLKNKSARIDLVYALSPLLENKLAILKTYPNTTATMETI
jgi:hypothetical protein